LSPASIFQLIESEILEKYQFVGLTQRMDESLAVMKLLFGFQVLDLIVTPSKVSGQALTAAGNNGICRKILKADLTLAAKMYMAQDFERGNYAYFL
jgi:hypothetical protein